ncbi:unnamed protein product [Clonostachys byssicola]|uniref:Large ribosomal subunit protein mL44 n=1 Tax=Clonostachys byssicola TaxID=160290 RepID=A0A9N9UW58_9HYPO|nr:unnamed protein product [Clonostachys byssicola]
MKGIRPSRWGGQLLHARSCPATIPRKNFLASTVRCQSTVPAPAAEDLIEQIPEEGETLPRKLPSPLPERALHSAKLAALHSRLSLSKKIPLQTLARALVTPSADPNPGFNNANLAFLGSTIINYHVAEYITCKWPRLPMAIHYEALRAFSGPESLAQISRRWGVEAAAAPGEEVDPGLLQWASNSSALVGTRWGGYVRAETDRKHSFYRRGMSSRVVLDNDFGDAVDAGSVKDAHQHHQDTSFSSFVQAVVGAIYSHSGREAAKDFVESHILSRQVDLSSLFEFQLPTRELAMLCAREGFEPPLARLESETGRHSRTPVYVVGIYSGKEKLGEGNAPSLDFARRKACMNALKSWYLYSPGNKVRVPSDMMEEGAKPWKAPHIDIGEVI